MEPQSVNCVVTSPPYFGLRAYGTEPQIWGGDPQCAHLFASRRYYTEKSAGVCCTDAFHEAGEANAARLKAARWREDATCERCGAWKGEFGLEESPERYVDNMVAIFREVWLVLRDDGTVWLNLGDSYATGSAGWHKESWPAGGSDVKKRTDTPKGLKAKDLIGIPWRVALALQQDGWYLRSDIIWAKGNPMPEAVTDRPSRSHEYLFLLTKRDRYFYDHEAVKEPVATPGRSSGNVTRKVATEGERGRLGTHLGSSVPWQDTTGRRNRRSVWNLNVRPFKGAHFATFPPELVEPCLLAGCPERGHVLDPFAGSGTVGLVAKRNGRLSTLIELKPEYAQMARDRIDQETEP